jgi:4a-hydroxytetrahydrobiopterin dehydratase
MEDTTQPENTEPFDEAQVKRELSVLTGWKYDTGTIRKQYTFASFRDSIAFVNRVADLAEAADHHPDIMIWYKVVTIVLTTHEIAGISKKDITLAIKIDMVQNN